MDLYLGGSEHATGHLLYVRFWTKVLFDLGFIPVEEPAKKLINQGMITGRSYYVYKFRDTNLFISQDLMNLWGNFAVQTGNVNAIAEISNLISNQFGSDYLSQILVEIKNIKDLIVATKPYIDVNCVNASDNLDINELRKKHPMYNAAKFWKNAKGIF